MYVLEVLPFKATRQVFSPGAVSAVSLVGSYEIDDEESKHNLQLAEHGHQEVPNAWVLLEKA